MGLKLLIKNLQEILDENNGEDLPVFARDDHQAYVDISKYSPSLNYILDEEGTYYCEELVDADDEDELREVLMIDDDLPIDMSEFRKVVKIN